MRSVFIKQGRWLYLCLESGDSVERMNFYQAPFFIDIAYTKKRPPFGQNSGAQKGGWLIKKDPLLPCLGVSIRQYLAYKD